MERQALLWRPAETSVHFVLARLMRHDKNPTGDMTDEWRKKYYKQVRDTFTCS